MRPRQKDSSMDSVMHTPKEMAAATRPVLTSAISGGLLICSTSTASLVLSKARRA
jgi:hypothetical protein